METVFPIVHSVIEIRDMLTHEIPKMKKDSKLEECARTMKNSCNKFLSKCKDDDDFRNIQLQKEIYIIRYFFLRSEN